MGEPTPGHNRASGIGPGGFGTCRRVCPGCSTSGRSNFRPRMAGRIEGVGRCVGDPTAGCNCRSGVGPGHARTRLQAGTRGSVRERPGAGPSGHVPPAVGTSQPRRPGVHRRPPAAPVRPRPGRAPLVHAAHSAPLWRAARHARCALTRPDAHDIRQAPAPGANRAGTDSSWQWPGRRPHARDC